MCQKKTMKSRNMKVGRFAAIGEIPLTAKRSASAANTAAQPMTSTLKHRAVGRRIAVVHRGKIEGTDFVNHR
jgi:hypothetical protein